MGERRVASSVVFGSVSLLLGVGGMLLGAWIGVTMADFSPAPEPENLVANAILSLGAILVAAVGGIIGFLVGVVFLAPVLALVLGWSRVVATAACTAAIEIVAVPLVVLAATVVEDSVAAEFTIPFAIVVLGGLVPGAARWLMGAKPSQS